MMDEPADIEVVREWFGRAAANAERQGRKESAMLWRDGLAHIERFARACDVTQVTRLTVVDSGGRAYERWDVAVRLSFQDDGRTLKVFVDDGAAGEKVRGRD